MWSSPIGISAQVRSEHRFDGVRATAVEADDPLASMSAEPKAACRAAGHALAQKVRDADRWIAATAIAPDPDLISDDAVFEQLPGLSLLTMRSS